MRSSWSRRTPVEVPNRCLLSHLKYGASLDFQSEEIGEHIRVCLVDHRSYCLDGTAKDISTLQSNQLRCGDDVYFEHKTIQVLVTPVGRVSMCWHCANKMKASLAFIFVFSFL